MATLLKVARLDRLTLVSKSGGKLAKHPKLRKRVVEVVKGAPESLAIDEALRQVLHGPQAMQKASEPDVSAMTFDEALRALLHSRD